MTTGSTDLPRPLLAIQGRSLVYGSPDPPRLTGDYAQDPAKERASHFPPSTSECPSSFECLVATPTTDAADETKIGQMQQRYTKARYTSQSWRQAALRAGDPRHGIVGRALVVTLLLCLSGQSVFALECVDDDAHAKVIGDQDQVSLIAHDNNTHDGCGICCDDCAGCGCCNHVATPPAATPSLIVASLFTHHPRGTGGPLLRRLPSDLLRVPITD